jgi:hypothetical protein
MVNLKDPDQKHSPVFSLSIIGIVLILVIYLFIWKGHS